MSELCGSLHQAYAQEIALEAIVAFPNMYQRDMRMIPDPLIIGGRASGGSHISVLSSNRRQMITHVQWMMGNLLG